MDKAILVALLNMWLEKLDISVDILEEYPELKNGRKVIYLKDSDEVKELWDVKYSIKNLITALEEKSQ